MKVFLVSLLLGFGVSGPETGTGSSGIVQVVSQGGRSAVLTASGQVLSMTTAMVEATEGVTDPDTVMRTDVKDPENPEEPVEVETRRRIGETHREQAKRHLDACDDVREEIKARNKKKATGTR